MAILQSDYGKGIKTMPYPRTAGVVTVARGQLTIPTSIAVNDIVELLGLPPGCDVVDAIFDTDDLDTGGSPAILWDIGLMSGTFGDSASARTCGDQLFAAITTSQAGGVARSTDKRAFRIGPASTARGIGAKLKTAAATPAAGTIGLTLFYAAV